MPETSLDLLDPRFRPIAEKFLAACKEKGLNIRVTETLRSPQRQIELAAAGVSQVKNGYHQRGLALDFALFDHNGVYQTNNLSGDYTIAGELAEAMGCVWGGRWKHLVDLGHIEIHLPEEPLVA